MDNCIFCKIAKGEIPSTTLYEDDDFKVIFDISPASPGHVLILPKVHCQDVCELPEELGGKVLSLAARIGKAMKTALPCDGFHLVQNNGTAAGQTVFHFHMHVIPRRTGDKPIVIWEPGISDPETLKKMAMDIAAEL